jgi:hypothetical protein
MGRIERIIVLTAMRYTAVYGLLFLSVFARAMIIGDQYFPLVIIPLHILGIALGLVAFGVTLRDLYLRPFPKRYWKFIWFFLIIYTGGIAWCVYIFKHAFKPRNSLELPAQALAAGANPGDLPDHASADDDNPYRSPRAR